MRRLLQGETLVLATRNKGKREIFQGLFKGLPLEIQGIETYTSLDPEETGETFLENALLKAKSYASCVSCPVLADDSGLVIPSLGGVPGVRSSRFAEDKGGYPSAFSFLEKALEGLDKEAFFETVLVLAWPDGHQEIFSSKVTGTLVFPPEGKGFGYTPIFKPKGCTRTFASMGPEERLIWSHRALACRALIESCGPR